MTASPEALRIDRWVAGVAGGGVVLTAVVCAAAALTERPLPGVGFLLGVATPLVFLGQLWTIGILTARMPMRSGSCRNPRRFFFGALPAPLAYGVVGAVVVGWLAALTAFPALSLGKPTGGLSDCPRALVRHGVVTCVSESTYQQSRAAGQRLAAGVAMAFLAVHFGVALNEVARRADDGR